MAEKRIKGQSFGFLGKKHSKKTKQKQSNAHRMEGNPMWRGGIRETKDGYIKIKLEDHPFADSSGCVMKHRLIMESHLGRHLLPTEVVHHINGEKRDNRIENLMLYEKGQKDHARDHCLRQWQARSIRRGEDESRKPVE